jgi:hypothetical protein
MRFLTAFWVQPLCKYDSTDHYYGCFGTATPGTYRPDQTNQNISSQTNAGTPMANTALILSHVWLFLVLARSIVVMALTTGLMPSRLYMYRRNTFSVRPDEIQIIRERCSCHQVWKMDGRWAPIAKLARGVFFAYLLADGDDNVPQELVEYL